MMQHMLCIIGKLLTTSKCCVANYHLGAAVSHIVIYIFKCQAAAGILVHFLSENIPVM